MVKVNKKNNNYKQNSSFPITMIMMLTLQIIYQKIRSRLLMSMLMQKKANNYNKITII